MTTKELLGLLPVFEAVFAEQNLSRAAERLGVSQSAISQSLARLRQITSDELFQSTGRGMRPTPRALLMSRHVRNALAEAAMAARASELHLDTLDRTFLIEIGAGIDALIMPALHLEVARQAPRAKLHVTSQRLGEPGHALRAGEIELALDFARSNAPGINSQLLVASPLVVIARPNHPAIRTPLSEAQYLSLNQVTVNWGRSVAPSGFLLSLMRTGREIRNTLSVPTIPAVGALVAETDLIATVSTAVAAELARRHAIEIHPLPFAMPNAELYLLWHSNFEEDPGHHWLRLTIEQVGANLKC